MNPHKFIALYRFSVYFKILATTASEKDVIGSSVYSFLVPLLLETVTKTQNQGMRYGTS